MAVFFRLKDGEQAGDKRLDDIIREVVSITEFGFSEDELDVVVTLFKVRVFGTWLTDYADACLGSARDAAHNTQVFVVPHYERFRSFLTAAAKEYLVTRVGRSGEKVVKGEFVRHFEMSLRPVMCDIMQAEPASVD